MKKYLLDTNICIYFDILIASTAVVNNLVMVTNSIAHLARIDNITIENWVASSIK